MDGLNTFHKATSYKHKQKRYMGTAIKHSILRLSPQRQSAWMSKITNDGLTRSGTKMFHACTHMATVDVKGLTTLE